MNIPTKIGFLLACLLLSATARYAPASPRQPNIVLIVADDLGYGDLGCYGQQKIETPHLDALADRGMRFRQFYSGSAVCAPARCVLLTGLHTGHAYVRGNDEWAERGEVWNFLKAAEDPNLEGQRPMPSDTRTLSSLLQGAGYATACVGKWGLGAPLSESRPNAMGFDFFYGYNCQRQAHNLYPPYQWRNGEKIRTQNTPFAPNAKLPEGADPNAPASYSGFRGREYAPALQLSEALGFLGQYARKKPFFLMYTSPLPHVALQAPSAVVDYYARKLGPEPPYLGQQGYLPCLAPRATYAAMVHILDEQVGAIVAELKKRGVEDNTLILFTSDNGPSYAGGTDPEFFQSAGPFDSRYGRGKGFLYEGGIRVPFIAVWPGHIQAGSESGHVAALWDLFPTLQEVARAPRQPGLDGLSLLPVFKGRRKAPGHPWLYWEFPEYGGQQALRMGKWKALRLEMQKGNLKTLLFNLEEDPREERNIAAEHPDVVAQIERIMAGEHRRSPIARFRIRALDEAGD